MRHRRLVLAVVLLLGACGFSPKTHFYTLVPAPPSQPAASQRATDMPVQVGDVNLPGTLDRLSLVLRGPGTSLIVSDQDQWAAPLDELMQRVLTADLRDRLGVRRVLAAGDARPPGGVVAVSLNVQQFSGDRAGDVVLEADWMIGRSNQSDELHTHHVVLRTKAGSDTAGAITEAMSRALGELADAIAVQVAGIGTSARR